MNLKNIREMARHLGVKNYSRFRKDDLIRVIQVKEGNDPCFKRINDCQVYDCLWRADCQESAAP